MPKTNPYLIPKENKVQIEEVREIENEYPTYEEFMKNYEIDKKVSESYANELGSYSDIAIPQIYGPGNQMSRQEKREVSSAVLKAELAITTFFCPPLGIAATVGCGIAGTTTAAVGANNGDAELMCDGLTILSSSAEHGVGQYDKVIKAKANSLGTKVLCHKECDKKNN